MDDLVVERRAERLAGLEGVLASDRPGVGGGVVGQAAGELLAAAVADADDVALLELALDLDDADGQQAVRARFEGLAGAVVDDEAAPGPGRRADPALAGLCGSGRAPGTACRPGSPARSRVSGSGRVPRR